MYAARACAPVGTIASKVHNMPSSHLNKDNLGWSPILATHDMIEVILRFQKMKNYTFGRADVLVFRHRVYYLITVLILQSDLQLLQLWEFLCTVHEYGEDEVLIPQGMQLNAEFQEWCWNVHKMHQCDYHLCWGVQRFQRRGEATRPWVQLHSARNVTLVR